MSLERLWQTGAGGRATLALVLVGLTLLLVQQNWLWRWDRVFYDAQMRLWDRPPAENIVIIAIDEASLREFGRWPWSRQVHADLLQALDREHPKAIAFDIIFAEPNPRNPEGDRAFASAIRDNGRVVLPVVMEQPGIDSQPVETLPLPALANAAAALGHVHVELDPDGIARELFLYEGLGEPHWPHISLALMSTAGEPVAAAPAESKGTRQAPGSPLVWYRSTPTLIPFAGPPGHFQHISYGQVLRKDYAPGTFRDKYVLIGTTAAGLGDALPTPLSGFSRSMSGVEINANMLDALQRGLSITPLGPGGRLALSGFLAFLPALLFPRRAPRTNLVITIALLTLCVAISAALLALAHQWFPPTAALLAVAVSFPLWSWRRLELAMRYLSQELDRLHEEQPQLRTSRADSIVTAVEFVAWVLPVDAWSLSDRQGKSLTCRGRQLSPPEVPPPATTWYAATGCLWLPVDAGKQLLGLHWSGDTPPDARQQQLLHRLSGPAPAPDNTLLARPESELQARIAQVQQATVHLRELRRFIDDSLANMADGVVVADTFGQVILSNSRAAWYLRGADDACLDGLPVTALLEDLVLDHNGDWHDAVRRAVLDGDRLEFSSRHHNGRDLLVQIAPLSRDARDHAGLIFNFSDISRLKASERKRNELLNFLSHDLRAPLVSMSALIDLARHRDPDEEITKLLTRMQRYTGNTLELAEQFLQLARAESSEAFTLREVDMVSVALNALEQVWGQAQRRRISLRQELAVAEAWMMGDGGLLERALVNLLDNAIKYSPDDTIVTLSVQITDDEISCCVADQGCGIDAAELPRLFERFRRIDRPDTDAARGAGLGLAFVDAVVQRHGGRATVNSETGQGSHFCLLLPAHTT